MTITQETLHTWAHELDLCLASWSPGDGRTRYRFFKATSGKHIDYFADEPLFTALGIAEAHTFLRGVAAGWATALTYSKQQITRRT